MDNTQNQHHFQQASSSLYQPQTLHPQTQMSTTSYSREEIAEARQGLRLLKERMAAASIGSAATAGGRR